MFKWLQSTWQRGPIDVCHETVRLWWNRFGPMFAAEIRRRRTQSLRAVPQWRWHVDEVFVKIKAEMHLTPPVSTLKD